MRLLFVRWHPSRRVGGLSVNTDCLTLELSRRGHEVVELTARFPALTRAPVERVVRALGSRIPVRHELVGAVHRHRAAVPEVSLVALSSSLKPDAVIVNSGGAWRREWDRRMLTVARSHPTILYVYDFAAVELAATAESRPALVAASEAVAAPLRARGLSVSVIVPVIDREAYRVQTTRRTVLFVNPKAAKGLDVALALAAGRPDIPFEFVGGPPDVGRQIRGLKNITHRRWIDDPAQLFADARLLLVPSRYPEVWPRVIGEAQASGIPALAIDRGGIREAVGQGGQLVSGDAGMAVWRGALDRLWEDEPTYAAYCAAALREGQRPELRPDFAAARLEELIERLKRRHPNPSVG